MKNLIKTIIAVTVISGVALYANCAYGSTHKYYFITHGSADFYWEALFNGARQAAKDLNVQLQVNAPPGANDIAAQVRLLRNALAANPAGIALTCPSETAFSYVLKQAHNKAIPVIVVDTKPENTKNNPFDSFIGSNNYKLGQALADKAIKSGKVKDRILIANPQGGNIGLEQRASGIKAVMKKHGVKVDELIVGTDPGQVQLLTSACLKKNTHTSAVITLTSQSLIPIANLVRKNKLSTAVFTFDNTPGTAQFIKEGIVNFTIAQQPFMMGYFAVTQMVLKQKYGLQPVDINTGYNFVTPENVAKVLPLIKKGIR
ncbi:substrate-binding domain-containing protein [Lentisphaerota bacterium ZTH]|nr:substrate-binding domain-containing protein [Lentisphaerota bacterium]WET07259.1 substrate-binding domain-containing protein [Lentisphaerota bacterium ZTH]